MGKQYEDLRDSFACRQIAKKSTISLDSRHRARTSLESHNMFQVANALCNNLGRQISLVRWRGPLRSLKHSRVNPFLSLKFLILASDLLDGHY